MNIRYLTIIVGAVVLAVLSGCGECTKPKIVSVDFNECSPGGHAPIPVSIDYKNSDIIYLAINDHDLLPQPVERDCTVQSVEFAIPPSRIDEINELRVRAHKIYSILPDRWSTVYSNFEIEPPSIVIRTKELEPKVCPPKGPKEPPKTIEFFLDACNYLGDVDLSITRSGFNIVPEFFALDLERVSFEASEYPEDQKRSLSKVFHLVINPIETEMPLPEVYELTIEATSSTEGYGNLQGTRDLTLTIQADNYVNSAEVTVEEPIIPVGGLATASVKVFRCSGADLKWDTVTWSSDAVDIATIDPVTGVIRGLSRGESRIVADLGPGVDIRPESKITVARKPDSAVSPFSEANGPYSGFTGSGIRFSSDGSVVPNGGNYLWDFGTGDDELSEEASPLHSFPLAGNYAVTLTVSAENSQSAHDESEVEVCSCTSPSDFPNLNPNEWVESNTFNNVSQYQTWIRQHNGASIWKDEDCTDSNGYYSPDHAMCTVTADYIDNKLVFSRSGLPPIASIDIELVEANNIYSFFSPDCRYVVVVECAIDDGAEETAEYQFRLFRTYDSSCQGTGINQIDPVGLATGVILPPLDQISVGSGQVATTVTLKYDPEFPPVELVYVCDEEGILIIRTISSRVGDIWSGNVGLYNTNNGHLIDSMGYDCLILPDDKPQYRVDLLDSKLCVRFRSSYENVEEPGGCN